MSAEGNEMRAVVALKMRQLAAVESFAHYINS
jgi:hypothetical protein